MNLSDLFFGVNVEKCLCVGVIITQRKTITGHNIVNFVRVRKYGSAVLKPKESFENQKLIQSSSFYTEYVPDRVLRINHALHVPAFEINLSDLYFCEICFLLSFVLFRMDG